MKDAISMKRQVLELLVPASIHILGFLVKWDMWYTNSTRISVSFALTTTRVSGFSLSTLFAWNITRVSASSCLHCNCCTGSHTTDLFSTVYLWHCHPMQSIGIALIKSGYTLVAATHKRGSWAMLTWTMVRVKLSGIQLNASVEDLLCCILHHRMETDSCLWQNRLVPTFHTSDAVATHLCRHKLVVYQPWYAVRTWHPPQ